MNEVTFIGSINLDHTIRVPRMARPGETLHTHEIFTAGGGKGANQAVAAARLGAKTHFVGAVGKDDAGAAMLELLNEEHIDTTGVAKLDKVATGQAFVIVDDNGENRILVHGGSNMAFTPEHVVAQSDKIAASDLVIAQFESDMKATLAGFKEAHQNKITTILNPAPATKDVLPELLAVTDMIVPNETEAQILTGVVVDDEASCQQAAAKLHAMGVAAVLITLGHRGTFYSFNGQSGIVPAFKVKAVDTTAAGDTFIGALSSVLKPDFSNLTDAIRYANQASSLTVQRFGAQPSIPYLHELQELNN